MNTSTFYKQSLFSLFTMRKIFRSPKTLFINFGVNQPTSYRLISNIFLGLILLFQNGNNSLLFVVFLTVYSIDLLRLTVLAGCQASFIIPTVILAVIRHSKMIGFPNLIYIFWAADVIQLLLIIIFLFLFVRETWVFDKHSGHLIVNWYNPYERKRETYCCELRRIVNASIFGSKVDIEQDPETFWGAVIIIRVLTKSLSFNQIRSPNPSFYPDILRPYIFLSIEEAQRIEQQICNFIKI